MDAKRARYEVRNLEPFRRHVGGVASSTVASTFDAYPPAQADHSEDPMGYKKYQPHSQSSRVLQVTGLAANVTEADLVQSLSQFGPVNYASITGPGTALVEFEDQSAAERCIAMTLTTEVLIAEQRAFYNYASINTIPRKGIESDRPSNVLVMYVNNAKYPITTEVVHKICSPISAVNRIMINRRDGIQALVEFPDFESARIVKQYLNGCDIYANCCTLKIEFAKLSRLNFTADGPDQADYTKDSGGGGGQGRPSLEQIKSEYPSAETDKRSAERSNVSLDRAPGDSATAQKQQYYAHRVDEMFPQGGGGDRTGRGVRDFTGANVEYHQERNGRAPYFDHQAPVYGRPAYDEVNGPSYEDMRPYSAGRQAFGAYGDGRYGYSDSRPAYADENAPYFDHRENYAPMYGGGSQGYPPVSCEEVPPRASDYPVYQEGVVIMIYGLDPEIVNCDRLFNLLCLYGNVMKIKFLITRNDTVMVEMMNLKGAQRVLDFLHNCRVFNKTVHVAFSRQPYLNEVRDPPKLKDGTPSYKDYSDSRLQRFSSPHIATKNRITHPQKFLYFFNAPPNVTEDNLAAVFREANAPLPVHVRIFSKREMVKNSAGIVEFDDQVAATEALMLCNHASVDCPGNKSPFIMKLCFAGPANTAVGGGGGGGASSMDARGRGNSPAVHYGEPSFMGPMSGRPRSSDYSRAYSSYDAGSPSGGYRSSSRGRKYDH